MIALTIRETIDRQKLIPDGTQVVVGVSGGADSVALLRILHELGIPLIVAHLNHQLRGEESEADEAFVRALAEELHLPLRIKAVDVKALAASAGRSIEMAARQARHDFFAEFENAVIALAHHADDQVETFILKLVRGAGPDGLCGMSFFQQLGPLRLIRPMLNCTRAEIQEWLRARGFAWREDASNTNETFLRNRVRHTVLPLLAELNPNVSNNLLRSMDILREENEWMNSSIADCRLPIADLPLAAQRRSLRKWLFDNGVEEVCFETVESILHLMKKGEGTTVYELNASQRVVVEYGHPRVESDALPPPRPEWILTTKRGFGWKRDCADAVGKLPAEASFNAAKVGDAPIEVRAFKPGDRMTPLGMMGSRKLQDIFTDLKLPRAQRDRVPVVVCRREIIWLPGYRIAADWAVADAVTDAVHVRIEKRMKCGAKSVL
ncbi:MAG: tRNA lysidine(34) synthetase TilS [Pontiellaceae bacterium]|nr:tRNA lysidine(34) synthetase TilS [Pontiellaceae bacterium]